jgi:lipoyl-dependent peroxiredoxin
MNSVYRTQATALGGRSGSAASSDGRLRVEMSTPKALGGEDGTGTNPEQLFAAGYAACFLSAIKRVAERDKLAIAADSNVTANVGVSLDETGTEHLLATTITVDLPGLDALTAEHIVARAQEICAFSIATRGNMDVEIRTN